MDFYDVKTCRRIFSKAIEFAGLKEFLGNPMDWKEYSAWDASNIGRDSKGLILECLDGYYMEYTVKENPQYSVEIKITADYAFHARIVTFTMHKNCKKRVEEVNTKRVVWFRDENDPDIISYIDPAKAYPYAAKDWDNAKMYKNTPAWPEIQEGHDLDKKAKKIS